MISPSMEYIPQFHWSLIACFVLGGWLVLYLSSKSRPHRLDHIPTAGCPSDSYLGSWIGALRYIKHAHAMVQEGYTQFPGKPFKVPTISGWLVVASSHQLIEDIKAAREDVLSFPAAVNDVLQINYTLGHEVVASRYHIPVIRNPLTRNIASCYTEIRAEILSSLRDEFAIEDQEWHQFPAFGFAMRIVARTANRLFVGAPLCRDPEYVKLTTEFTKNVVKTSLLLNLFPTFLRPLAGRLVGPLPAALRQARRLLGPTVANRISQQTKRGKNWAHRPNDLISWLLEYAEGDALNVKSIVNHILLVNFSSIHTTTMAFTNVLFDIAARPEYIEPLRQEIESVLASERGWSKSAIGKMPQLDSFVKESLRLHSIGAIMSTRKVMKGFNFSDGTSVPVGSTVCIPGLTIHLDEAKYPSADMFDGFRFSKLSTLEHESTSHLSTSPSLSYLPFGIGRNTCPGRFLATIEIKTLLAQLLISYDIRFEDGKRPRNGWILQSTQLDKKAQISVRKRQRPTSTKLQS